MSARSDMPTPAYTDFSGLAGIALAFAASLLALPGIQRLPRPRLAALLSAAAVVALVPFGTLPIAGYVRGAIGDLSITTLLLLGGAIARSVNGAPAVTSRTTFMWLGSISVVALAFYPMALGVGMFDPYRLGFGSPWLFGVLLAVTLAAWFGRFDAIATCVALAVLAWTVRWYESTNLWDYLLDPLVSLYALGALAARGMGRVANAFRDSRRATPPIV